MNIEKFFEILDIESIEDFRYFDNFAALAECEEDIDYDDIYYITSHLETGILKGLISDYFEDMAGGVPEEEAELYILIDNIKRTLMGLCDNNDDDNQFVLLSEEILKFRNWYNFDTDVLCTDNETGESQMLRIKNALMSYRFDKMNGNECSYDFSQSMNYEIDEYVVSFSQDSENDEYDYTSGREEEALLESNYLYDDEFSDEY